MYRVTCFKDESLDVVTPKDVQLPVIRMANVAIIEENLVV